ncbi:Hypothetical predicted protein [Olea europaea subsp. europaea]|uniref:Uncharacterized protein n=1 Tax=Olea europaea subsp. europaea TaxID=158383 RepID=A0A8S0V5Y8_OLEEU|nr:Hypothetical predicted protein [Olea europaea subsp. europaea]
MTTTVTSSIFVAAPMDSSASFGTPEGSFCRVHARMTNAKAMRANITAIPPNRYGIGDFHVDVLANLIFLGRQFHEEAEQRELGIGIASCVGFSSPANITTNLGPISAALVLSGFCIDFSSSLFEARFRYEQARMINATEMSNNIRVNPPKRYGNGEFQFQNGVEIVLAGLISVSLSESGRM